MVKTLQEVLHEQYPNIMQHLHVIVVWDQVNSAVKFNSRAWPYDIYSTCPTQAQLDAWMNE